MQSPESVSTYYGQNPAVVFKQDPWIEGLLFLPETRQIQELNETATFIWHLCAEPHDLAQIEAALEMAFEIVSIETSRAEIASFVEGMANKGFLLATSTREA